MFWLPLAIAALTLFYIYTRWIGSYWTRKNVASSPSSDFINNFIANLRMKEHYAMFLDRMYKRYRKSPYFGVFTFFKPALVIVDLDMVKTVLTTEFASFQQNDFDIDEELEPLFATNPFAQSGAKWKNSRSQITPAFTSGRMKAIYPLMLEVSERLSKYIEKMEKDKGKDGLDAKEISGMFAMDNVASCAFGINAESFTNPNSEFIRFGKKLFEPTTINIIKITLAFMMPWVAKIFRVRFLPKETTDWMSAVVSDTVKYRKNNKVTRDDFLQIMMNLREKEQSEHKLTDLEMTGHSLSFLTDGYETSSGALAFTFYEVANNKEVQDKLREEIEDTIQKHDGNMTYEAIMEMSYLERVLYENLRKNSPALLMQKRCTKQCTLAGRISGGEDVTLNPGDSVMIPVYSIHRDPEYYPDPEAFNPDRFMEEEKTERHPYAFLGFGGGPRMCLGMRFALLQMKVALANTVRNFKLSVSPKTREPIELEPKGFLFIAKGGLWVNFTKI